MIRTVAELLSEIVKAQLPKLDASEIRHAPTIGDMYEGLATDILERSIPPQLELQVVSGFVSDGSGTISGQIDCMLVRGQGERIPYSDAYVWPLNDVIAVIEVKKKLYRSELFDSLDHLNEISQMEMRQAIDKGPLRRGVSYDDAYRTFSEITGRSCPTFDDVEQLPESDQMIFHSLVGDRGGIARIVFGLHGFASEAGLRDAMIKILSKNVGAKGFGPRFFPQLIISGRYSLYKVNGRPYSIRLIDEHWPLVCSTSASPLILLLEAIWTRIDEIYAVPELWGDDLRVEVLHPLLLAKGSRAGWNYGVVEISDEKLREMSGDEDWEPSFLSAEEHVILSLLCNGVQIDLSDGYLAEIFPDTSLDSIEFRENLVNTGLVTFHGDEVRLITVACATAVTNSGDFVAAENNTGRLTRWMQRRNGV